MDAKESIGETIEFKKNIYEIRRRNEIQEKAKVEDNLPPTGNSRRLRHYGRSVTTDKPQCLQIMRPGALRPEVALAPLNPTHHHHHQETTAVHSVALSSGSRSDTEVACRRSEQRNTSILLLKKERKKD